MRDKINTCPSGISKLIGGKLTNVKGWSLYTNPLNISKL